MVPASRVLIAAGLLAAALIVPALHAQVIPRVDPHFTHFRVYCVSPVTGSGKSGDPVRASAVPSAGMLSPRGDAADSGPVVLGSITVLSDDGKWALSEIVFRDHQAAQQAVANHPSDVWAVEKGTVPRTVIEAEFRKYKGNLDLDQFGAVVR